MIGGPEKFAPVLVPFVTSQRKQAVELVPFVTSQRVDFQEHEKEIRCDVQSISWSGSRYSLNSTRGFPAFLLSGGDLHFLCPPPGVALLLRCLLF